MANICEQQPVEQFAPFCPCYQIAQVRSNWDEIPLEKLDHVSPQAMAASCHTWVTGAVVHGTLGESAPQRLWLPDGRSTMPINLLDAPYPIPLNGFTHDVVMVIEQWIEDDPDGRLIPILEANPGWQSALESCALGHQMLSKVCEPDGYQPDIGFCRIALHQHGLPATPGAARYLLSQYAPDLYNRLYPDVKPEPTRGAMVLCIVLAPRAAWHTTHAETVMSVTGVYPWTTMTLMAEGAHRAARIKEWVDRLDLLDVPKVDYRSSNRRDPDDLAVRVDKCVSGIIPEFTLFAEMVEREEATLGRRLKGKEPNQIRKRMKERLRRARKLRESVQNPPR